MASQTLYLDCRDAIRVNMHFVSTLFDSMGTLAASNVQSDNPLNFEALNQANKWKRPNLCKSDAFLQSFGLVVYETELPDHTFTDPVLLSVPGLRDRGYVFLDYRY